MNCMVILPDALPCSFADCPPGLYVTVDLTGIGIKDEYDGRGYNEAGEYWCSDVPVIPCRMEVVNDED